MLRIASSDFHAAAKSAKAADKAIIREMRRGIRLAGQGTTQAIKSEIGQIPSSGRHGTGVRAALQAGTRVSIATASQRSAGVTIVTDPRRLPAKRRVLAKALNLATFRHPVYADGAKMRDNRTKGYRALTAARGGVEPGSWTWVEQMGRPYFGGVILARKQQMESDIWRALSRAQYEVEAQQQKAGSDVR